MMEQLKGIVSQYDLEDITPRDFRRCFANCVMRER